MATWAKRLVTLPQLPLVSLEHMLVMTHAGAVRASAVAAKGRARLAGPADACRRYERKGWDVTAEATGPLCASVGVLTVTACLPVVVMQAEGLVHVSNISSARLSSAKEAVERGQDVWVKVVSVRYVRGWWTAGVPVLLTGGYSS